MRAWGFILARGGSKRIPEKNIRPLAGKPLITWTIEAARRASSLDRIFVSTDCPNIARTAESEGVEVLLRPPELARDDSLAHPVFMHHLSEIAEREPLPPIIVDLRPTSPLRGPRRIAEAIEKLKREGEAVDSVRGVTLAAKHPYKMWRLSRGLLTPLFSEKEIGIKEPYDACTQFLPEVYQNNGAVYAIWLKTITEKNSLTGTRVAPLIMEPWESVNIDTEEDFLLAEILMRKYAARLSSD